MKFVILCVSAMLVGLISAQQNGQRDNRCPSNESPFNPTHLAHPSDCTKFFKCSQGNAFELRCPNGQHWNRNYSYCDSIERAHCTSQQQPQWPIVTVVHPTYLDCPQYDSATTIYYPHHLTCAAFYQCKGGRAIYLTCPEGFHWNSAQKYCDFPTSANCRLNN